jgi:hypothetical protein
VDGEVVIENNVYLFFNAELDNDSYNILKKKKDWVFLWSLFYWQYLPRNKSDI